ncbi:hypothetical protein H072_9005 [Dactylellina haptotyla CBS 200.50]|uniref:Activator of Hsp90 ATPase AHSA1-like N-terminal domain-containing protein n=1 Tax=Dactylellina haptotyla (strain CBS 200.50) TaxID=1284197 RepID=S8A2V2_DACHA|nr:hypothetical protein H072_9005 [Dactylellina haptotyla CBS 200.50]
MVLHNPNNWHWVNKDASAWAKEYFEDNLIGISAEGETGVMAKIDKILSVDGDVDVSQRKGKVITLFDVKLQLEFSGKTASGDDVSGTITIPEVAHDTEIDEYVFEITNYSDTQEKQPVRDIIRNQLTPQIRTKLSHFGSALIDHHGKDIQHTKDNDPKYRSSPAPGHATSSASASSSQFPASTALDHASNTNKTQSSVLNTANITETFEFQTSAEELYKTFVDSDRVKYFTRSQPEIFEPSTGGVFKLFGGNVEGKFLALVPNEKIVQNWRLSSWPQGN